MSMKQIIEETRARASEAMFRDAQTASRVRQMAVGKSKRKAGKIKFVKIIEAVKLNPVAYRVGIDDYNHVGLEVVHGPSGSLHITHEIATQVRTIIEAGRKQLQQQNDHGGVL